MSRFFYYFEYHFIDILAGSAAMFMCYAFARMVGARFFVALTFAILPFFVARAYDVGSSRELLAALLQYN